MLSAPVYCMPVDPSGGSRLGHMQGGWGPRGKGLEYKKNGMIIVPLWAGVKFVEWSCIGY